MADDAGEDRNVVQRVVDRIKDAATDADLERGLTNQAAAMPGAGEDLSYAGGASTGPSAGFTPGGGAAAAGSLTDEDPIGRADDPAYENDR